jgi:UDP-N-acetylmuramoyl-L-alanyl-D-glutamate--2,6-diaminopimelate ligase
MNTTADAITIQRFLAEMQEQGFQYVAMEVSSHALAQGRVNGVEFYAAIYTNLTQDHLDYHLTLEAYAEAKKKLFINFNPVISVFNVDDEIVRKTMEEVEQLSSQREVPGGGKLGSRDTKIYGYSIKDDLRSPPCQGRARVGLPTRAEGTPSNSPLTGGGSNFLSAQILSYTPSGMKAELQFPSSVQKVDIPLIGDFNLSNVLAVLTLLSAMEIDAIDKLSLLKPVAGRMQLITAENHPSVIVDYAHTPDALEKVLKTLSLYKPQKLGCVFGCGGDRDKTKRPLMAEVASRYANEIILTDDNPRTENPKVIINDILMGIPKDKPYQIIHNRRTAIQTAITKAGPDDMILIAGKGHEDYQEINSERFYFSDVEEVEKIIK